MLRLSFTPDEMSTLHQERFQHPHPRVQQRIEALWLKSQGLSHQEICRLAGMSGNTLRKYLRLYQAEGIAGLKVLNFHRPVSALVEHWGTLEDDLLSQPPATVNEAAARIKKLTGLTRSPTQVRQFLRQLGLRRLKVGCLPAKADADAQAAFKKSSCCRGCARPKPDSAWCCLWMPPTSCLARSWAISGVVCASG